MKNIIFKILSKIFLLSLIIFTAAEAKTFKIKKLEIELFKEDNLLKSIKILPEGGWGLIKANVYAEKNDDNEVTSIIKIVTTRIDKYGKDVKVFLESYLFKDGVSLLKNTENKNFFLLDDKKINTLSVQELNLQKYLNTQDEIPEFKRAITNLKKKYNVKLPDRVLRSDHIYLRGNGNIIWVSHMFDYQKLFAKETFDVNDSKFHPNSINKYPGIKKYMDKWINLSLSRHQEFQNKLKIKNKLNLAYGSYDENINLKNYKKEFYEYKFTSNNQKNLEIEKKAAVLKAKEEEERKAKEEKERKAKEEKERKAKEEEERKAKEEKERKAKEEKSKSNDETSVDDLMSKIKELNEMYKSGLISKDEFEMLKKKLLKN